MTDSIAVSKDQFEKMQRQINDLNSVIYGKGKRQSRIVTEIVTALSHKLDSDRLLADLNTLKIMGWALIILVIVSIVLMCVF